MRDVAHVLEPERGRDGGLEPAPLLALAVGEAQVVLGAVVERVVDEAQVVEVVEVGDLDLLHEARVRHVEHGLGALIVDRDAAKGRINLGKQSQGFPSALMEIWEAFQAYNSPANGSHMMM